MLTLNVWWYIFAHLPCVFRPLAITSRRIIIHPLCSLCAAITASITGALLLHRVVCLHWHLYPTNAASLYTALCLASRRALKSRRRGHVTVFFCSAPLPRVTPIRNAINAEPLSLDPAFAYYACSIYMYTHIARDMGLTIGARSGVLLWYTLDKHGCRI